MPITPMTVHHAEAVLAIYRHGIDTGDATFETTPPSWTDFDRHHLPDHRYIAHHDGTVTGWIAAEATSTKPAYRGVVEHSVYIAPHARGTGIGSRLLATLIDSCEAAGIWTIQAGILADNIASLALHDKHDFRIVGVRHRIGQTPDGRWRDVTVLERRSTRVG